MFADRRVAAAARVRGGLDKLRERRKERYAKMEAQSTRPREAPTLSATAGGQGRPEFADDAEMKKLMMGGIRPRGDVDFVNGRPVQATRPAEQYRQLARKIRARSTRPPERPLPPEMEGGETPPMLPPEIADESGYDMPSDFRYEPPTLSAAAMPWHRAARRLLRI